MLTWTPDLAVRFGSAVIGVVLVLAVVVARVVPGARGLGEWLSAVLVAFGLACLVVAILGVELAGQIGAGIVIAVVVVIAWVAS